MSPNDEDPGIPPPQLDALPREIEPPADLERRVVAALRRGGHLAPRARAPRAWMATAAAAAIFAAGVLVGRTAPDPAPEPPAGLAQFLLLLYEPTPLAVADDRDLVAEYGAWARGLARQGRLASAEKLAEASVRLPERAATAAEVEPTGFFVVRAASLDEALEIARGCPHLAHGGEIRVRPVDPT
jgi:hypothetical protein